jgi:glycosyltransferase involved in cell wall biosynthesis
MAGAVGKLLSDEGLRRKLGEAAAERARERFSWEVIVGEYEGMLERCVR